MDIRALIRVQALSIEVDESWLVKRIYELLLELGYPPSGIDWLRRHRLPAIIVMALLSWALFLIVGWLIWWAFT